MYEFDKDVAKVSSMLVGKVGKIAEKNLQLITQKLSYLYRQNMVKINHSIMELVCAAYLIVKGYWVDVEHRLDSNLVCDVYAEGKDDTVIVEIETGFSPPDHAVDPGTYLKVRVVSKIARYSNLADRFYLGTPYYNFLPIHPAFYARPEMGQEDIEEIKRMCDMYYSNPPVQENEIKVAKLDGIMVVDVDELSVLEISPKEYMESLEKIAFLKDKLLIR